MVENGVFLLKPKNQNCLSQQGESAQSCKKKRLLCESMLFPIEKWTSNLKMVGKEVFLWNQSIKIVYHNKENVFIVPYQEKKIDDYVNPCLY